MVGVRSMKFLRIVLIALSASAHFAQASDAAAECRVLPGPDGELSSWLVLGPIATPNARPSRTVDAQLSAVFPGLDPEQLAPRVTSTVGPRGPRWTAVASSSALFDPGPAVRGRGPRTAFFGATLDARERIRVQLFAGGDDGMAVFLDGLEVGRRGAVRGAREDDDRWALDLAAGRHRLVLRSYVHGGDQRAYLRLVGEDFRPTNGVRVLLEGVDDSGCDALARSAARLRVERAVQPDGTRVDVTLSYPGGTPARDSDRVRELLIEPSAAASARVTIPLDGVFAGAATAWVVSAPDEPSLHARSPAGDRVIDTRVPPAVRSALLAARAALASIDERSPPSWLPRGSVWSVAHHAQRLASLVSDGDRDAEHISSEAQSLAQLSVDLRAGRDPYASRRGPMRRAYRSEVDGSLQPYSIYVPPSYRAERASPVVVALHGLGGSSHRMLPILFGVYDKDEDRTHADRHFAELPDSRAILVAPYGFGDTFYRGIGEHDVLAALDAVRAAYRVDENRTYMTGLSMGGIGAASIPLHRPEIFAAAAPLCGYHDYFVRTDARGHRRPWELFLMESRSNRSWAENGLHLPMYVVQGLRDRPVANSSTFVDRWRELGYAIESEYPELGHDVWSTTYAGGRIVPYFLRFARDPSPSRVRFRTVSTRWAKSYWLEVDGLAQRGAWAEIDASVSGARLRATTQNVSAFTASPPVRGAYEAVIDGQPPIRVEGAASFERREGRWALATTRVREPVVGPIRDAIDGPTLVVYGARTPAESAMNRRVAEAWARPNAHVRSNIRVIADDAYTPADARGRTVVLVGTPASNAVIERMQPSLPLRVDGGVVRTHDRALTGATGAVFVAPSPDAADGRVVVVTGTSALGVWRSRFLPDLVPDFVVFDDGIAPARGRVILGRYARVLCAGFYDRTGRVGPRCEDTPPPASSAAEEPERASD
jgi:poly(3-hydroxybutyrate) depolymerase